jgi:hypothetical protein
METVITLVRNKILDLEDADLNALSEAEEYEKDRLLTQTPSRAWRTTGDTSEYIDFDFGAPAEIDSVGIFAHNLTDDATITLQADDNAGFTTPEEEDLVWNADKIIKFFTGKTYKYWRLLIADDANPDTYIQIGNVVLGLRAELCAPLPRGWQLTPVNPSIITEAAGGQEYTRIKQKYNRISVTFSETNPLCADDYDAVKALLEEGGADEAIILSIKQGSDLYSHSFYGRIENYSDFKEITPSGHRTWSFEFREAL